MTSSTDTSRAPASKLDEARRQLELGNHNAASLLYWDAATDAIDDAAERIGFQLTRRHQYSDVCEMLEPWCNRDHVFGLYSSMSLLRRNALERYDFEEVWVRELADDIHELFDILQSVASKHGD